MPMKINIKRIDKTLPLPKYETSGSVGFDLICRESAEIAPQSIVLIPANVVVETPPGYMLMVCLRSSTPRKLGLMMPQGVGIVDNDYCGEEGRIENPSLQFHGRGCERRKRQSDCARDFCPCGYSRME